MPAALYHHFADKEQLYLDTVKYAFRAKTAAARKIVAAAGDPFASLEAFVLWFAQTLAREGNFRKLLQWVLLDADPVRTRQLVQETFSELFAAIQQLADSFRSRYDPTCCRSGSSAWWHSTIRPRTRASCCRAIG